MLSRCAENRIMPPLELPIVQHFCGRSSNSSNHPSLGMALYRLRKASLSACRFTQPLRGYPRRVRPAGHPFVLLRKTFAVGLVPNGFENEVLPGMIRYSQD